MQVVGPHADSDLIETACAGAPAAPSDAPPSQVDPWLLPTERPSGMESVKDRCLSGSADLHAAVASVSGT